MRKLFDKESRILAEKVYDIEHANYRQQKEWQEQGVTKHKLTDNVYMEKSDDHMVWYLWKTFPDQARLFCKVVPSFHLYADSIESILKSQGWVCI